MMSQYRLEKLVIKPTLACTANCPTCQLRKSLHRELLGGRKLSFEQWMTIFADASQLGVKRLDISGGEPTLYKQLMDLIQAGKQYGWYVNVNSNGSLIDEDYAQRLLAAGLDSISISLYSADPQIHDQMRRLNGLWEKATRAVKIFSHLREAYPRFKIATQSLLCRENYRGLRDLVELHYNLGSDMIAFTYLEGDFEGQFLLNEGEIAEFRREVLPQVRSFCLTLDPAVRSEAVRVVESVYSEAINSHANFAKGIYRPSELNLPPCQRPKNFTILLANGDVHPCNMVEYSHEPVMGNLFDKSLSEIWHGEKWNRFRESLFDYCRLCPINLYMAIPLRPRPSQRAASRDNQRFPPPQSRSSLALAGRSERVPKPIGGSDSACRSSATQPVEPRDEGECPNLEESQYWPYERLVAFQNERLRRLLEYAYAQIPGYRRKFEQAGLTPADIKSLNDLHRLPMTTREELQQNEDFANRALVRRTMYTGGSTGTSLRYYESEIAGRVRWNAHLRGWKWGGYEPGMRCCILKSAQSIVREGDTVHLIGDLSEKNLARNLEIVRSHKPEHLKGYVGSLYIFARYCLDRGIRLEGVVSAIPSSENLYDEQRGVMEEAFGCQVFEEYCCNDGGACAWECEKREGLHYFMERAIIEDVDGKQIVTDLWNLAMPFIRYENGDSVRFLGRKCSCGRELPLLSVKGRTNDIIITPSGVITPTFLMHHGIGLVGVDKERPNFRSGIRTVQYVQKPGYRLEVNVVRNPWCTDTDVENLKRDIHRFAGGLQVNVHFVDRIWTTKKGKTSFVINEDKELLQRYLSGRLEDKAARGAGIPDRPERITIDRNSSERSGPSEPSTQTVVAAPRVDDAATAPRVSVLMCVYNGEGFVREALQSIYDQTYQDFEVVIVDDASSDRTPEILRELKDARTAIYRNAENLGLTKSLNVGLRLCRGEYVARMDADDISHRCRLEKQVQFLDGHPDCLVVGTWCHRIDAAGEVSGDWKPCTDSEEVRNRLMTTNALAHGSAMVRRAALLQVGGYDETYQYAQDYDLWLRMSERGDVRNLAEQLYALRCWPGAISVDRKSEQDACAERAKEAARRRRTSSASSKALIAKAEGPPVGSQSCARTASPPLEGFGAERRQASANRPQLSVVLTTYNRPELLEKVLDGFAAQTAARQDFEMIVVDDGSVPPVKEMAGRFSDAMNLKYLRQDNGGLAAARNAGIQAAEGDLLLFSDDDDVPSPELVAEHIGSHREHPDECVAVLGHLDWHPSLEMTPLMHYVTHVGGEYFGFDKLQDGQFYNQWKWWGGLVSAKRSLLDGVEGPFDTRLRFGYEDTELMCRLLGRQIRILYNARAKSYVLRAVSFGDFCVRSYKQGKALHRVAAAHPDIIVPRYQLERAVAEYQSKYAGHLEEWVAKVSTFENLVTDQKNTAGSIRQEHLRALHTGYRECFRGHLLKGYVEQLEAVSNGRVRIDDPVNENVAAPQPVRVPTLCPEPRSDDATDGDNEVESRRESPWRRITFVNSCTPAYDKGSSNLRIYHLLKILTSAGHKIDHLHYVRYAADARYKASFNGDVRFIATSPTPNGFSDYMHFNRVEDLDCVWITNLWTVGFFELALEIVRWLRRHRPDVKIIVDTMDFHAKKYMRRFELSQDQEDLSKAQRFLELERQLYPLADLVLAVTPVERQNILENVGADLNVAIIPNIHSVPTETPSLEQRKHICFLGAFKVKHNLDAVRWFRNEVFPLILQAVPEVEFHVYGYGNEDRRDSIPAHSQMRVIGYVPDAEEAVATHRLFVCPMIYGAGMKGKMGVAAGVGTPIVTTSIGAEGFGLRHGHDCFIADSPQDFADRCVQLLRDDGLWRTFSDRVRQLMADRFSVDVVGRQLDALLGQFGCVESQRKPQTVDSVRDRRPEVCRTGRPCVSVVTACHNCETYLPECLDSIRGQTMGNWELLLVDDGSTDGTRGVIEEYSRCDPRIKPIYFDENAGPYVRRNLAIEKADSDFIVIQDADDIMSPAKLDILFAEISRSPELAVVGSHYRTFLQQFKGLQYTDVIDLPLDQEEILDKCATWRHGFSHGSAIIRKSLFELIGGYDENPFASDSFWSAKLAEYAGRDREIRVRNVPEYLTLIRVHTTNQTQLLPTFDPRSRRTRYHQYCECKLNRIREKGPSLSTAEVAAELRACDCSDFLTRFEAQIITWESQPLQPEVMSSLLQTAVALFDHGCYVSCVSFLNGIEVMDRRTAECFRNFDLLRALTLYALDAKGRSRFYLDREIANHDSVAAKEFLRDSLEGDRTDDVQKWCAVHAEHLNLQIEEAPLSRSGVGPSPVVVSQNLGCGL